MVPGADHVQGSFTNSASLMLPAASPWAGRARHHDERLVKQDFRVHIVLGDNPA